MKMQPYLSFNRNRHLHKVSIIFHKI